MWDRYKSKNKLPRLILVSGSFPNIACGVSPHTERIARLTAERDLYDVHVLTSADAAVDISAAQGYQVHPCIKKWSMRKAGEIRREILAREPDVIHIQNPTIKYYGWNSLTMSVLVPRLKKMAPRIPLVVTQHDIAVGQPIFRRRYRPMFWAADAVLVSNSRDEQAVLAQGIDAAKLYRAPVSSHIKLTARSEEAKAAARRAMGISPEALCIVYFGFIHPARNIDVWIKTLHCLSQSNDDIHGIILGGAFPGQEKYHQQCRNLAEKSGLTRKMTWTGYAREDQIAQGLAAADVFVSLPQRGADMRNSSIITGMLAELPVVTTTNRRYYEDEDLKTMGCIMVSADQPEEISRAIEDCRLNPPSADFLARRREFLDADKIWREHIDVHFRAYRNLPPEPARKFNG